MQFNLIRYSLLTSLLLTACAAPKARIMGDDEGDLVGGNRAGSATYDRLVQGATQELLAKYTNQVLGGATPTGLNVAFAGIYNKQTEELGEWRDELNQIVDTAINDFVGFSTVSQRYVGVALREANLTVDDLFLPPKRREFFKVLEIQAGNPVKALVFATITGGEQQQGGTRQRRYRLTLDMIDSETGKNLKADAAVRKEYGK